MGKTLLVAIVDYGLGNILSVRNAFEAIGASVVIAKGPSGFEACDRVVLPGVGAFESGMNNLKRTGLKEKLEELVLDKKKPFLGICLGMQLLADKGFEFGEHNGLGWIKGAVEKLPETAELKIPHVGWNNVNPLRGNFLFNGLGQTPVFYFVHSYHFVCKNRSDVAATCNYGVDFAAAIQHENIFATQFHPEKSQLVGLQLLRNFLGWDGGKVD